MRHPLASTVAKFSRGQLHLGEFRGLLAGHRDAIRMDADLQLDLPYYRWIFEAGTEDPDWSAIIGDCIHNFRACLDHLMWGLAREDGGKTGGWTHFPVLTDDRWTGKDRADARKSLAQLSAEHRRIIKAAQPYHGWDGPGNHPILELHKFDRIDKHRDLNPALVLPIGTEFQIVKTRDCEILDIQPEGLGQRLEPGAVIAVVHIRVTGPYPHVDVEAVFARHVQFENGDDVLTTLERIADNLWTTVLHPVMPGAELVEVSKRHHLA